MADAFILNFFFLHIANVSIPSWTVNKHKESTTYDKEVPIKKALCDIKITHASE